MPGASTTCTAIPTSGAGTGRMRSCPAESIPTCTSPSPRRRGIGPAMCRGCAGAGAGPTTAGLAGPPADCGSNRSGATTTSAFALWPFSRSHQESKDRLRRTLILSSSLIGAPPLVAPPRGVAGASWIGFPAPAIAQSLRPTSFPVVAAGSTFGGVVIAAQKNWCKFSFIVPRKRTDTTLPPCC